MSVIVGDVMVEKVLTAEPHHTVERLRRIMEQNHVYTIPVVGHGGDVRGIVTAIDVARAVKDHTPASHIMTERYYTISPDCDVQEAAALMRQHRVHQLVVMQDQKVVGIISVFDVIKLVEEYQVVLP